MWVQQQLQELCAGSAAVLDAFDWHQQAHQILLSPRDFSALIDIELAGSRGILVVLPILWHDHLSWQRHSLRIEYYCTEDLA